MLHEITYLILLFITVSICGWLIEVTLKYQQFHRFINRGFLTGPWLPIYGAGAVLITVAVRLISQVENAYGTTFVISFILCGGLEYVISWYLEKRYHARWWDYSQRPMNLKGRIWIGNLVLFGLGGVVIMHGVNPLLAMALAPLSYQAQYILAVVFSLIFAADFIVSHFVMRLVKRGVESSEADNTEEMRAEVQLMLRDRSYFARRFADAYPDVVYRTERIQARMEAVRAEAERLRAEAEARMESVSERVDEKLESVSQRIEEAQAEVSERIENLSERIENGKAQIAYNLESTSSIQSGIIQKQDELINLMYDEDTASKEAKQLRESIDRDKERIRARSLRKDALS